MINKIKYLQYRKYRSNFVYLTKQCTLKSGI